MSRFSVVLSKHVGFCDLHNFEFDLSNMVAEFHVLPKLAHLAQPLKKFAIHLIYSLMLHNRWTFYLDILA